MASTSFPYGDQPSSNIIEEPSPMSVLQASIAVIPNDQFVSGVGMRHVEFDGVVGKYLAEHDITAC